MAHGGPTADPETLTAIAAACRDSLRLRFGYRAHDGTESVRTTEPHRLVHTGRRWYLVGWDVDREDWRTYRVDRLDPRTPTGPRFTPRTPPDPDLGAYTSRAISTSAYRYQARFTLQVSAETAAERIAPTTAAPEPIDEHSCTLWAGSDSLDELAVYVAGSGFDFRVHEPPELVEHIRALATRLAGAI
jgi:predicted DNA-binding transcriptional regulator YafY